MPYAPPRACARCGALLAHGARCPRCRPSWANPHDMGADWPRQRTAALRRDRHRCVDCGNPTNEVDHMVPRAEGGTNDLANLASRCELCHDRRTRAQQADGHRRLRRPQAM
jgi:5-methylcytosine-specific restriction protein A